MKKFTPVFLYFFFIGLNLSAQEETYLEFNTNTGCPVNQIYQIEGEETGEKWMSTIGGGILHWTDKEKVTQYNSLNSVLEADSIFSTFKDSQENLWIATFGAGLVKVEPSGLWHYYTTENSVLPSNFVTDVVEDQQCNIYVSTIEFMSVLTDDIENGGIIKISPDGIWTHYSKDNSPLTTNNTFSMLVDPDNNLWIGTINAATPESFLDEGGGLCRLSPTGEWTIYNTSNSGIGADNIMSLAMDEVGNLYAGSLDGYLSRLDTEGNWFFNAFVPYTFNGAIDARGSILNLYYHKGDLYVGFGPSDLLCLPDVFISESQLEGFVKYPDVVHSFVNTSSIAYGETDDENGVNIWIHLIKNYVEGKDIDLDFYSWTEFMFHVNYGETDTYYPFIEFTVSSFYIDRDDNLWIGTVGGGVYIFNENGVRNVDLCTLVETPPTALALEEDKEISSSNSIHIYPNPTTDNISIVFDESLLYQTVLIRVVNMEGKIFYQKNQEVHCKKNPLELSNLSNGIYLVQVYKEGDLLSSERIEVLR